MPMHFPHRCISILVHAFWRVNSDQHLIPVYDRPRWVHRTLNYMMFCSDEILYPWYNLPVVI
jgi:hypothetical protein